MKKFLLAVGLLSLAGTALAAGKPCGELKSEIDAKIQAKVAAKYAKKAKRVEPVESIPAD